MQDRTWTLTTADGNTYEAISQLDAAGAIDRIMRGAKPFEQDSRSAVGAGIASSHELPLAA
jgi:hypothetical protein